MAKCWEMRGCDDEMQSECVHSAPDDKCPAACAFAKCDRPSHEVTTDAALVFDPTVDRRPAIRVECTYCGFFLRHGPRL